MDSYENMANEMRAIANRYDQLEGEVVKFRNTLSLVDPEANMRINHLQFDFSERDRIKVQYIDRDYEVRFATVQGEHSLRTEISFVRIMPTFEVKEIGVIHMNGEGDIYGLANPKQESLNARNDNDPLLIVMHFILQDIDSA